jgi:hypothetical protein
MTMTVKTEEVASEVEELTKDDFVALFSDMPLVMSASEVRD